MGTTMDRTDHTATGADEPAFIALWQAHRGRMLDLAFRMLLDLRDAEDVVQEAFDRLARADIGRIDDPEGWLVVVTSRLCSTGCGAADGTRRARSSTPGTPSTRTRSIRRTASPSSTTSPWRCTPCSNG
jgi:DNA-directed RNA polymerase specialized sigma24 family protein